MEDTINFLVNGGYLFSIIYNHILLVDTLEWLGKFVAFAQLFLLFQNKRCLRNDHFDTHSILLDRNHLRIGLPSPQFSTLDV